MKLSVRIHGLKKRKVIKILCFIVFLFALGTSLCGGSVVCLAWSAGGLKSTIASIVISMLMSSGAGVTNMDWLTKLNTAYGVNSSIGTIENAISSGLLSEISGDLIDTGLSEAIMNNAAYSDLGLDYLFSTTADDLIIQSGTQIATGGANLATEAIGVAKLGTAGQAFVAIGAGIGLGVLANHFIQKYVKPMFAGQPIDPLPDALDNLPAGYRMKYSQQANDIVHFYYLPSNCYAFKYNSSVTGYNFNVGIANFGSESVIVVDNYYVDGVFQRSYNRTLRAYSATSTNWFSPQGVITGENDLPYYEYNDLNVIDNLRSWYDNNNFPKNFSPDVIGDNGNQVGTYDSVNQQYLFPDLKPYYNPQNTGIRPIDMDDYMDFAERANDLTDEDKTGVDQADNFKDFIDPYLVDQVPELPDPDPDYTDPDQIPEQPDYNPKNPVSPEDIDTSDPYTTPDLMDKFPFCIPNDILSIFQKFRMNRQAPQIEWNFKYDAIGLDETIIIDFSEYDSAASLLRTLEVILFTVGLGVATRKLIGG